MQQDWNIRMRSEACAVTGKNFEEGELFYTALYREGDEFRRSDLCEEAWARLSADTETAAPFSSWRSRYEPPAPAAPEPLPKDDAEGMLRSLLESNDPAHANTRYLLAVMLERKRILRPQPSSAEGILVYEHSRTGETLVIQDPHLSLADLAAVQQEVSALLAGLAAPVTPAETSVPEGEPATPEVGGSPVAAA